MSPTNLLDADTEALSPRQEPPSLVLMFERLAKDPAVDVAKLEKLIEMQERIMRHNAKAAFDAAFIKMRPEIPTIQERAKTDKTTYAPLEDIVEVVTPILSRHGFSLAFKTEWPDGSRVKVIGQLTHEQGHSRESEFMSAADKTGSKNDIQALASTVSYGKRYTAKDLLCIVTREEDDDGKRSGQKAKPKQPEGYDLWATALDSVADNGLKEFEEAWKQSKSMFRNYRMAHEPELHAKLKAKAAKVKS